MTNKKILIVDDEPNNLQLLRQILRDEYALIFANNGKEAISATKKHQPDLILLDIMMPGMNGYEVCQHLKQNSLTNHIPVIFITAMSDIGHEAEGFKAGGVDYITKPISPATVRARVKAHLSLVRVSELEQSQRAAVFMIGDAGHYNDDDTGVHIWRMAAYSLVIAKTLGWSPAQCQLLELAAPMHDTGKIGIADTILKKPAKLNADEWQTMQTHTTIGHDILTHSHTPLFQMAAEIAKYHHEKWNGQGYPYRLAETDIPESARIVAIADVFDALTMKRPYKQAWSVEDAAAEIIHCSGSHFEPRLVQIFHQMLPELVTIKNQWDSQKPLHQL